MVIAGRCVRICRGGVIGVACPAINHIAGTSTRCVVEVLTIGDGLKGTRCLCCSHRPAVGAGSAGIEVEGTHTIIVCGVDVGSVGGVSVDLTPAERIGALSCAIGVEVFCVRKSSDITTIRYEGSGHPSADMDVTDVKP